MQNIGKKKTIAISPANYEALRDLGKTGDSFDDVLSGVIKSASLHKKVNEDR